MSIKIKKMWRSKNKNTLYNEFVDKEVCVSKNALHAFTHTCRKDYIKCMIKSSNKTHATIIIDNNTLLRVQWFNIKQITDTLVEKVCYGTCS